MATVPTLLTRIDWARKGVLAGSGALFTGPFDTVMPSVDPVKISRGASADFGTEASGEMSFTLDNPDHRYTPDRNWMDNPSFEIDTSGWNIAPALSWTAFATSINRVNDQAGLGGVQAGEAVLTATSNSGVYYRIPYTFRQGVTYQFAVSLKSVSGNLNVRAGLAQVNTGDGASTGSNITTAWARYTGSWTPSADRNDVLFFVRTTTAAAATVRIDAIQINAGATLNTYIEAPTKGDLLPGKPVHCMAMYGLTTWVNALSSLVSYWRLGEAPGSSTAVDQKGANNGTYMNTPVLGVPGVLNDDTAVYFSRPQSEYVLCKSGRIAAGQANWTIGAWVKTPPIVPSTTVATGTPVVQSTNFGGQTPGAGTTRTVNLPSGITAGDLLLLMFNSEFATTTTPAGWTRVAGDGVQYNGTNGNAYVFKRIATGSEGATLSVTISADQYNGYNVYRISGADTADPPLTSFLAGAPTTTPDAPANNPGLGARDWLSIPVYWWDNSNFTSLPSGYSNLINYTANSAKVASGTKSLTGATGDDPGTAVAASGTWLSYTILVSPPVTTFAAVDQAVYTERSASGNDMLKLEITATGLPRGRYRDDAGTLNDTNGNVRLDDNQWHHLIWEMSGTVFLLYVDGTLSGTALRTATTTFTNASPETRIGGDAGDATAYFLGAIDEVYVATAAVLAGTVTSLYKPKFYGQVRRITPDPANEKVTFTCRDVLQAMSEMDGNATIGAYQFNTGREHRILALEDFARGNKNMLGNPSFETNLNQWQDTSAIATRNTTDAAPGGGIACAQLAATAASQTFGTLDPQGFRSYWHAGESYTFSVWARNTAGVGLQRWTLGLQIGSEHVNRPIDVPGTWTRFSITLTITANQTAVASIANPYIQSTLTSTIRIDNCAFTRGPAMLPYSPAGVGRFPNMCSNGSFEAGLSGWADSFASGPGGMVAAAITNNTSTTTKLYGGVAGQFGTPATALCGKYYDFNSPGAFFRSGVTYNLSVQVRCTANLSVKVGIAGKISAGVWDDANTTVALTANTWTQISVNWTPSADRSANATQTVVAYVIQIAATATTLFIDGLRVVPGTSADSYEANEWAGMPASSENNVLLTGAPFSGSVLAILADLNQLHISRHWIKPAVGPPYWQYTTEDRATFAAKTEVMAIVETIEGWDSLDLDIDAVANAVQVSWSTGSPPILTSYDSRDGSVDRFDIRPGQSVNATNKWLKDDAFAAAEALLTRYAWPRQRPVMTQINHFDVQTVLDLNDAITVTFARFLLAAKPFIVQREDLTVSQNGRSWVTTYQLEEFPF